MPHIGRLNETTLHEQLKYLYAGNTGRVEQLVDGYVVDVVRGDELVEIQTGGFLRLRQKIVALRERFDLRIVYPVAVRTHIVKLSRSGELMSSRKSPKRGRVEDLFWEVMRIADLLPHPRVTIEVALAHVVEVRSDDGKGSWRRHGVSVVERKLDHVEQVISLGGADDYLALLPATAGERFTNTTLTGAMNLPYRSVQPITNSLRKMGLIEVVEKKGREYVFARTGG